jgi:hypothetical protein
MEYLLVAPDWTGRMSAEQAAERESRIFHCDMCSDARTMVYHNIVGLHRHVDKRRIEAGLIQESALS